MDIPVVDMKATGENINRLRLAAGMSVREMRDIFGFSTGQAIYNWFHGSSMPSIDNLVILAKILNTTIDDIIIVEYV